MNDKKKYVRFKYTEKDLEDACQAVASGSLSLNKAHKVFKIPKSTLHNKITQKVPMQRKLGAFTQLTELEEQKLAEWIIKKAKCGFPMHPNELQSTVKKYLDANNRKSIFINNKPGRKWLKLFLSRHAEISKRNAEVISRARASVTESSIRKWFEELNDFLKENVAEDIFDHPERIFNADETGVQMCPKSGALLTPKNFKNSYQIAPGKEKEQLTVLCNISANGEAAPPLLVYPYKRIPRDIIEAIPEEWGIGRSDSGWMISETFLDYIKNVFHPWLIKKNIELPVIMFLDGHKSHINKELFEYCNVNKILIFCLYPNATHILQPCDVSFFKSLKNAWREAVIGFKEANPTKVLTRYNFAKVFEEAYNKTVSKPNVISNGFRKCGLYPLNPNSVDYTKCVTSTISEVAPRHAAVSVSSSISDLNISDVQGTIKVLKHLTSDSERIHFDDSIAGNKTYEHPYFPLWSFCKSFLSANDVPLSQQQQSFLTADDVLVSQEQHNINIVLSETSSLQERECISPKLTEVTQLDLVPGECINNNEYLLSDLTQVTEFKVVNGECVNGNEYLLSDLTHVTEFDEIMDGTSTSFDKNITGSEIEVLLSDENLILDGNDNIFSLNITEHDTSKHTSNTDTNNTVIPLPWYEDKKVNAEKPTAAIKTTTNIDNFLSVPSLNHPTRKRKTTLMPYGITCKKMKDYFNDQDKKKTEKEENMKVKKALRIEKINALKEKKETIRKKRELKGNKKIPEKSHNINKTKASQDPDTKTKVLEENKKFTRKINTEKYIDDTNTLNGPTENINRRDLTNVTYGDYILVKFEESKSTKLFVGKIIMINDEENKIKVDFLRKKRQNKLASELFVYPPVKDIYEVHTQAIVDILEVRETTRRGEIIFTKDLKGAQ